MLGRSGAVRRAGGAHTRRERALPASPALVPAMYDDLGFRFISASFQPSARGPGRAPVARVLELTLVLVVLAPAAPRTKERISLIGGIRLAGAEKRASQVTATITA